MKSTHFNYDLCANRAPDVTISKEIYEQRAKDINRAAAISLQSLARALGCRIESLLEP